MANDQSAASAQPSRPVLRPYLTIVDGLGLDAVAIPKSATSKRKAPSRTVGTTAANDDTIPESSRNNTLASLAGTMRRTGMLTDAIEAALQLVNLRQCKPPLDPSEVSAIATSIGRYPAASSDDVLKTLTDTGNASRFGARNADQVRYVTGLGWFIWDDLRWQRDSTAKIMEMAKQVARDIYREGDAVADDTARMVIVKHSRASQQAPRLKAMLELAQSLPALVVQAHELDANDMLLGIANGVVDLTTGKLRPAHREDLISRHSPVALDAGAKCPLFTAFIDQVTGGDKRLARYLQRVVGYALTGIANERCIFFLYGSGANGKSVFLNVVRGLLGADLASQTQSETLMVRRSGPTNDIARLHSVRVVIANEVEDGTALAEALVKQMTGGEKVSARYLYHENFEYTPKYKIFMGGNHKPIIHGRDNGIWDRMRLIPFNVTIPPSQRDKRLLEKLLTELPGILNWAIKGCLEWQKSGLVDPPTITDAVNLYRAEMDVIDQWTHDRCRTGSAVEWKASEAYQSYRMWALDNGYKPMASGMFGRDLATTFKKVKRNDANYFLGITRR